MSANIIPFRKRPSDPHVLLSYDGTHGVYVVELVNRRSVMDGPVDLAFEGHQRQAAIEYAVAAADLHKLPMISSVDGRAA